LSDSPEAAVRPVLAAVERGDFEVLDNLFSKDILYQDPRFVRRGLGAAKKQFQEAERQLGRKLPVDLRVRLHRENGGGIRSAGDEWQRFPCMIYQIEKELRGRRTISFVRPYGPWLR
jgi:hypothetical protein